MTQYHHTDGFLKIARDRGYELIPFEHDPIMREQQALEEMRKATKLTNVAKAELGRMTGQDEIRKQQRRSSVWRDYRQSQSIIWSTTMPR